MCKFIKYGKIPINYGICIIKHFKARNRYGNVISSNLEFFYTRSQNR